MCSRARASRCLDAFIMNLLSNPSGSNYNVGAEAEWEIAGLLQARQSSYTAPHQFISGSSVQVA